MTQNNVPVRVGLLELLQHSIGTQFVIPAYQRNYTWTANREVKQLFEDIQSILDGKYSKHFIGIMIYLEKTISPFQTERSVIDGQQRLTTIFLTLYAIKELMLENGKEHEANTLENMYLINQYNESNKFKLKPLVSDDMVYQQIVNRNITSIKEKKSNVYLNFIHIKNILSENLITHSFNDILLAMNKLYIVCVPIGEDDYPQKIFESINATGAKLTASDLIRNFILMPIVSDLQDEFYEKYWKKIEELISSDSKKLEAFFRFFIMAKKRMLINKNAVYKSFTAWYDDNIKDCNVKDIFCEIVKYASYYNSLYIAPIELLDSCLQKPVEELRLILSDMPVPLLLELYNLYKQGETSGNSLITSEQLSEIITILNSYLMRRSLCGMDTSDISRYFPELLKEIIIECNGDYSNLVEIFKKDLVNRNKNNLREMPDDKKIVDRIKYANMYSLRTWVNFFFRKLESEGNPAPVDFSKLSIEHLMPQTPTPNWFTVLGITRNEYEDNVHRLGNLTLAAKSDNSKMSNKVWDYKNTILKSTNHLKINIPLLLKEQWTINEIDNRTDALIKEIIRLYPYYGISDIKLNKIPIFIQSGDIFALGVYYLDNKSVEIEKGSTLNSDCIMNNYNSKIEEFRQMLIEEKIIAEVDGKLVFINNYTFHSKSQSALTISANIILCNSTNGNDCWCTEDGNKIGTYLNHIVDNTSANKYAVKEKYKNTKLKESKSFFTTNEVHNSPSNKDIWLIRKNIDWSILTAGLTLPTDTHESIQNLNGGKVSIGEKRNIIVLINNERYEAFLTRENYDYRAHDIMQIRYTRNSPIALKLRNIYNETFHNLEEKRYCKENGIAFNKYIITQYLIVYATNEPNVFRFVCN